MSAAPAQPCPEKLHGISYSIPADYAMPRICPEKLSAQPRFADEIRRFPAAAVGSQISADRKI
jgi:hypothetical protein